jgi:UDP-2,3-diacylglucosamine hydrolase
MKAIFLSDAHLRTKESPVYRRLLSFLDSLLGNTDRVFIAGDFFDFWFCSGERVCPEFMPMVEKILALSRAGISVIYLEGNHDFFLHDYYSAHGIATVHDAASVELEGKKVYVSHGDTVDRANTRYLFLRRLLRSRAAYLLQKYLPSALLWRVAGMCSDLSRESYVGADERLAGIMESFAMTKFAEGFDAVIFGHCHTPLLKKITHDGREKVFALLGDLVVHGSYVVYENGTFSLRYFRDDTRAGGPHAK